MKHSNIFFQQKKALFSAISLVWLLLFELSIIIVLREKCDYLFGLLLFLMIFPLIILSIIGKRIHGFKLWPRTTIITRLMSNVIAPTWLGALYLFFFVIHIGWLTDGSLNLFLHKAYPNSTEIIESLLTGILGTICIISFFPDSRPDMKQKANKILISGISPIVNTPPTLSFPKFNIIPLFKLLEKTKINSDNCKFIILYSNYYEIDEIDGNGKVPKTKSDKRQIIVKTLELDEEIKNNSTSLINIYFNETDFEDSDLLYKTLPITINNLSATGLLKVLIKYLADKTIPGINKVWLKNNVSIHFTRSCNYNDYQTCFNTLNDEISKLDFENTEVWFNLTPGTAAISAIVTLLSIDAKHKLFYFSQDENDKNDPIKEIDKSNLPFESLLSQALETIRK